METRFESFLEYHGLISRLRNQVDNMEMLCEMAQVSGSFYKGVGLDFRTLCIRNQIYRLSGETWATAFQDAPRRWFPFWKTDHWRDAIQIRISDFSERVAMIHPKWIVVLSLDLKKPIVRTFVFSKKVKDGAIDPHGKYLIVYLETFSDVLVYDILTGVLITLEKRLNISRNYEYIYDDTTERIFCTFTQSWHTLNIRRNSRVRFQNGRNILDDKYIYFTVDDADVYAFEIKTGESFKITECRGHDYIFYGMNNNTHLLLVEGQTNHFEIYDVGSKKSLFVHSGAGRCITDILSDKVISYGDDKFLCLDERTGCWYWHPKCTKDFWNDPRLTRFRFDPVTFKTKNLVQINLTKDPIYSCKKMFFMEFEKGNLRFIPYNCDKELNTEGHFLALVYKQLIIRHEITDTNQTDILRHFLD